MNTPAIAQNLAARGRGEDKMLVHMTPSEVQGLQALAMAKGGSLTINPETGLPEAGFLSDTFKALAPTIIGAGLTYFSGGAINPYMAAGIVGGVEGLRKDDLGAGLMAGLGAFGGANLVGSLEAMGAAGASAGVGNTGSMVSAAPGAGGIGLGGQGINQAALGGTYGTAGTAGTSGAVMPGVGNISPAMARQTTSSLVGSGTGASIPGMQGAASGPFGVQGINTAATPANINMAGGASNITPATYTDVPIIESGYPQGVADFKAFPGTGEQQLQTFYPRQETAQIIDKSYGVGEVDKIAAAREGYAPSFRQNVGTGVDRLFEEGGVSEFAKNYPGGKLGLAALAAGPAIGVLDAAGAFDQPEMAMAKEESYNYEGPYLPTERTARFRGRDAILGGSGEEFRYFDPVNPYPAVRTAADGGLMAARGRLLKGPGDGVSDSIPAVIGDDQPVLLSDGEYIIPAEVVSAVGDGSTDAGGREFTKFVNSVMANTRKVAKGKPNGADKLLKGLLPQTA